MSTTTPISIHQAPSVGQVVSPKKKGRSKPPPVMSDPWLKEKSRRLIDAATREILPPELLSLILDYSIGIETAPILDQVDRFLALGFPNAESGEERIRGFLNAPVFENWNGFVSPQDMAGHSVKRIVGIADGTIAHGMVCVLKETVNESDRYTYLSICRIHNKHLFSAFERAYLPKDLYYRSVTHYYSPVPVGVFKTQASMSFHFEIFNDPRFYHPDKEVVTQGPNLTPTRDLSVGIGNAMEKISLKWLDILSLTIFRNHGFNITWRNRIGACLFNVESTSQKKKDEFLKATHNMWLESEFSSRRSPIDQWLSYYTDWIQSGWAPLLLDQISPMLSESKGS